MVHLHSRGVSTPQRQSPGRVRRGRQGASPFHPVGDTPMRVLRALLACCFALALFGLLTADAAGQKKPPKDKDKKDKETKSTIDKDKLHGTWVWKQQVDAKIEGVVVTLELKRDGKGKRVSTV